jgi:ubiquinone/menaquinone biosynthesis C-methylase UbiE
MHTRVNDLLAHIDARRGQGDIDLTTIEARKQEELQFHDRYRDHSKLENIDQDTFDMIYGNKRFYGITESSNSYVADWMSSNAKDKIFLDYACGDGANSQLAARGGAALAVGIDLSAVSVNNAAAAAMAAGLGNTAFLQADCENTGFPDGTFDTVICSGVLHHMDLSYAFPELRRILADGGRVLCVEALSINPVIQWYRNRTPAMRTAWETEHILGPKDLKFAERFFKIGELKYWHLSSMAAAYQPKLLPALNKVDSALLRIPGIQKLAWIFTFELIRD